MLVNTLFENKVERLHDVIKRLDYALTAAGIPYQTIGGYAIYCHVERIDPLAARLTRDVDVAINRLDLQRIAEAVKAYGFTYRHAAGVDMLVDANAPQARTAIHMVFAGEKVRAQYLEPVPGLSTPARTSSGVMIAPVADLVRMKLTSFRLKDRVHVQDL